jgi:glutamate dehydrogenase
MAMTRTDFWQRDGGGNPRPGVAFKLDPQRLSLLPAPRPQFEIFTHSPRVEGVHLRGGRIARGGLRWSDRREDYRTEVLGLMKAQTVKNAVIVPVGAKGGFVVRGTVTPAEVTACYREFVAALLSLTDNVVGGAVVPPPDTVRRDGDDPYLVVAADKGTATFSDLANELSAQYGFWLGDAFASGGSEGYDHKRMGITARGAWEAVRRHFRELGTDVQRTDFTAVGIGDMSGDVFGNGMLRSPHIRLVAAFDHRHVFVDPDPDAAAGFAERRRLFALPSSSWADYDPAAISAGGGVWPRSAKSVALSPQARAALGIAAEALTPDELIRAILRAPVDLLWNGGIGTYVKARSETDADVGDRANDPVRVTASELRCRVVGEGGNLGFTQLARVEFAIAGGRINTDAIDNVGGVNCSDREVNIKILLDAVVASGEMTVEQRNEQLHAMTDEVAALVLRDSYTQTQALSLAAGHAGALLDLHVRVMRHLEQTAGLDRALEFLPGEEEIADRRVHDRGLTSPELAVLMAYTKTSLHAALLACDLPDDPYLAAELVRYFPASLPPAATGAMTRHRLRREIVATHLTNDFVDHAGISAAFTLAEETGADAADVVRGFVVARDAYGMGELWQAVESLDHLADPQTQTQILQEGRKLLERAGRWLLRNRPRPLDLAGNVERYAPGATALAAVLPAALEGAERHELTELARRLQEGGVPEPLAARAATLGLGAAALDAVEIAEATGAPLEEALLAYFRVGSRFSLSRLRERILALPRGTRWDALARAALRDDCATLHRALSIAVLQAGGEDVEGAIGAWSAAHATPLRRYRGILADIEASRSYDLTTLSVALREGRGLL